LFVAYLVFALLLKENEKWNKTELFIVLICSILPFGTFYIDQKYLQK
jgi:integral membrane protein